ncbi:hypothetical protein E2C01_001716 [Portunus trituberculatus]|uniref:Uncharacterized protein n=1 Tax=Portunus trituberculatus TaxID=210409 RepID=A0A5B7CN67_PORTR|nr:hypothetical protein [Portunus trituberculatus]
MVFTKQVPLEGYVWVAILKLDRLAFYFQNLTIGGFFIASEDLQLISSIVWTSRHLRPGMEDGEKQPNRILFHRKE